MGGTLMSGKILTSFLCVVCFLAGAYFVIDRALADCTPWTAAGPTGIQPYSQGCPPAGPSSNDLSQLYKSEQRLVRWPDGWPDGMGLPVTARSTGWCQAYFPRCHWAFEEGFANANPGSAYYRTWYPCWPEFFVPEYHSNGDYVQTVFLSDGPSITRVSCSPPLGDVKDKVSAPPMDCRRGSSDDSVLQQHTCPGGGGGGDCETTDLDFDGWDACEDCDDSYYDPYNQCNGTFCESCAFDEDCYECDLTSYCAASRCYTTTPILIDINGDGYHLTSAAGGVAFDMSGYGSTQALSWTAGGSDDAWLVLDRNGNGIVENGKELFGSATPQAHTGNAPNGFNALAHYDRPLAGGNGDGVIDSRDAIFTSLRLWQDLNHNGISEPGELHTLPQLGVSRIDLDYKESRRTDQYGNRFRYRAKVYDSHGAHVGRWAWDVSLVPLR